VAFLAGITSATDDRVVMFLGNAEEAVVPFVLPGDAFGCLSNGNAVSVTIDANAFFKIYDWCLFFLGDQRASLRLHAERK